MNNLQQKYVDEVNAYLALPVAEREIEKGAMLMLKGNRNQTLHKTVIRKSWHEKVEYELKKILGEKLAIAQSEKPNEEITDEVTSETNSIAELEVTLSKQVTRANEFDVKGKRADHDKLPQDIYIIPELNNQIYQKLRSLHEKLKLMNGDNFTAEDRKPVLDEFTKLDTKLRENWEKYDTYVIGQPVNEVKTVAAIDAKRIGANRTFLSRQAKKEKLSDEDIAETQNRFDEMIANSVVVSPEITEKLKTLGIKVAEIAPEVPAEPVSPAPKVTDENKPEEITEAVVPAPENKEENKESTDLDKEVQEKAEKTLLLSIKGMLKSNLDAEVIKNAFSGVEKVGDKDLTPELLQELIDAATAELAEQDVDAQV